MLEELAVGAQHKIPYVHVLVNSSYLGLIGQAQIGLDINFEVNLEIADINSPELGVYGVDPRIPHAILVAYAPSATHGNEAVAWRRSKQCYRRRNSVPRQRC